MGVEVGEVGEGDRSGPGRGAKGLKPGGGGTQMHLWPSTILVERPGRRGPTPEALLESVELQGPEVAQAAVLGSASPLSDGRSGLRDRRLCGNRNGVKTPKMQG